MSVLIQRRCYNCRVNQGSDCLRCHYCIHKCTCVKCPLCRQLVTYSAVCQKCRRCNAHHTGYIFKSTNDFPHRNCEYIPEQATKFLLNPLPRALGVEIELSNWHNFHPSSLKHAKGTVVHDGSVRPSGNELVVGKMLGDEYLVHMGELAQSLTLNMCEVNTTCGYHVHVDAIDLTPRLLRKLYIGFALIQKQLWGTLVAKYRRTSPDVYSFCKELDPVHIPTLMAMTRSSQVMTWLTNHLYSLDHTKYTPEEYRYKLNYHKGHKYENQARRQALNFHSWMMRGTVEFRLKEGTVAPADLIMWPLWCGWFVHKVSAMTDKQLTTWIGKPPTLVELAKGWAVGPSPCPQDLVAWVEAKCKQV